MKTSTPECADVTSAVGGSVSQVSLADSAIGRRAATTHRGGIRGRIKGFSRASRRNLLRRLASINRSTFRAYEGRLISIHNIYLYSTRSVCLGLLKLGY